MKSSCKRFDVYDFKEEDELAESASAKMVSRFKNPSAIDKYKLVQNVAQGTNVQSKEVTDLQRVDIDAIDNDHNCDVASYIPLGMEGEHLDTKQMQGLDDILLCNSTSHEQHPQFISDKLKLGGFSTQRESRTLISEAAFPGDSHLNSANGESSSSGGSVDVLPDADGSISDSPPSTSSDIARDDIPLVEHNPLSDNCLGHWNLDDRNVAVVCPEYVVYRGRYCTESLLIFSSSCIELKGSTVDENQEALNFQWGIDDIVNIESECSVRLELALVKVHLISKEEKQAEDVQRTSGIEELHFAVVDLNWYEKQEGIMSLDVRYKALWNVVFDAGIRGDGEALTRQNGVCIPKKRYFPNFEPFEEVVYPKGDSDAVSISKRDVDLLQPDTFVNDTIIDFYIKYLKNEMQPEKRNRFHFFNSFFFRKLIDLDKDQPSAFESRAAFQRVRKWTKKVNLFEKDYIFIPVNFNYHWSLIVVCHPGEIAKFQDEDLYKSLKVPCILHMDSIKGNHTGLKDLVQSYLWEEWKERQKETSEDISSKFFNLRFVPLELPQQQNSFDCGLFLLHYVERFLADAPLEFNPFKITKLSNFLSMDWFPPAEPSLKRADIENLICEILKKETSPAACGGKACISNHLTSNIQIETGVEVVSERCSNLKSCHGNLSSSQAGQGIEITLLPTSSQCCGDSGLVLREFLEAGATAGSFIDGQYQTFNRATSFNEFKGAISAMEEDVEATGEFVYSPSNRTGMEQLAGIASGACAFPYSSRDFGADTTWNSEIHQTGHEDIDASPATSICASEDSSDVEVKETDEVEEDLVRYSLDLEVKGNNDVEEDLGQGCLELEVKENNVAEEEAGQGCLELEARESNEVVEDLVREDRMDQPISPSTANVGCLTDRLAPTPDETIDLADSQSSDQIDSNGNTDHISIPGTFSAISHQDSDVRENGNIECTDLHLMGHNVVPEPVPEQVVGRIADDLPSLLDVQQTAKRMADESVPESDELQPAKRLRAAPVKEEETLTRTL